MRNIDENNVDEYIEELRNRTKGKYITQGVSFNKNCNRQISLLKKALLESSSFSGLVKEMMALRFVDAQGQRVNQGLSHQHFNGYQGQGMDQQISKEQLEDWM